MTAPEQVLIDPARLREAMTLGGRADVTVRSKKSGRHVRVSLSAKKRGEDGRYVSRATKAGRVGLPDADVIFANDPTVDFHESGLAKLNLTGRYAGRTFTDTQDEARAYTARMLLDVARGERESFPESAEVYLAVRCCVCNAKLEDPKSIERGIGPECYGKATGSRALPHEQLAVVA